jgi:hypothetical protein
VKDAEDCARSLTQVATRELQNFVPRAEDVVVHQLARGLGVAFFYGVENSAMLIPRQLSVVADVDGGVHDAFHLTARGFDSLKQEVISRKSSNIQVKLSILPNKVLVALAVTDSVFRVGQLLQTLQERGVHAFPGGEVRASAFHSGAVVVEIGQILH